jgi:hypothetical protein
VSLESPKKRLIVGILLFIALVVLCSYYASENENHTKYPSYNAILSDYPQQEVVSVYGTVTQVSGDSFGIQENYRGQIITMKILTGASTSNKIPMVSIKDKVTLVGVLGPDNTIVSVEKVEVNEYWKYIFILARSFLALIFLAYIFNRYWYFDREKIVFRRR